MIMEKDIPIDQIQLYLTHLDDNSEDEEEDESNDSVVDFVAKKLREFYVDNIPVDIVKELPHSGKYVVGALCYAISIGIFIYFTIVNYQSSLNSKFISLSISSGDCASVPISITDSFYADTTGSWVGSPGFLYYQAIYHFQFSDFKASQMSDYTDMMSTYRDSLIFYGERSASENLGINAILWTSYVRYYTGDDPLTTTNFTNIGRGNLQYMELTGDPSVIFSSRYCGSVISTGAGLCPVESITNFDQANAQFEVTLSSPSSSILNNALCSVIIKDFVLEYPIDFASYYPLYLDARSFLVAIGVNLGYTDIDNLESSSGTINTIELEYQNISAIYSIGQYYDIRYPYMKPILCMKNLTVLPISNEHLDWGQMQQLCLLSSGSGVFLPIMNHIGNSFSFPEYCDCNDPSVGRSTQCNALHLMASLVTYEIHFTEEDENLIWKYYLNYFFILLAKKYKGSYYQLNREGFTAQSSSVLLSKGIAHPNVTQQYLNESFEFCRFPGGPECHLLTFYTVNLNPYVSEYHYPLKNGSCTNAIVISESAWDLLTETTPTALTQSYFSCLTTVDDALLNAIGVASGNTSIAMLILLFICVPSVILTMALCKATPKEQEFSDKEKERTLDSLATLILRVRDENYEGIPNGKETVIAGITEELVSAVKYSNRSVLLEKGLVEDWDEEVLNRQSSVQSVEFDPLHHRELLGKVLIYPNEHRNNKLSSVEDRQDQADQHGEDDRNTGKDNPMKRQPSRVGKPDSRKKTNSSPVKSSPVKIHSRRQFQSPLKPQTGGNARNNVPFVQLSSADIERGPTALHYDLTLRLRVMNSFDYLIPEPDHSHEWKDVYNSQDLQLLVQGLLLYFSNAIRNQVIREKALVVRDSDGQLSSEAITLYQRDEDYAKGCILSQKLLEVPVLELLNGQDPGLFNGLANVLCMHASLDLKKDMKEIARTYGDRVSYQIGDKIFLYTTLIAYSLSNSDS